MSDSAFHTTCIRELKLSVRVLVFSVLNVSEFICSLTCSRTLKKQCIHVQVGHLSRDFTFDLFEFLSKFFFLNLFSKLGVRLICECGLYTGVYGNFYILMTTSGIKFQKSITAQAQNKKIIDLKTVLLNDAGLERNRFYFCRCVVANARAIYRFSVTVSDYILCIVWV